MDIVEWRKLWKVRIKEQASQAKEPEAAMQLLEVIEAISEECWLVSWMDGIDEILANLVFFNTPGSYGCSFVRQGRLDELRNLHEKSGGWWCWRYGQKITFFTGTLRQCLDFIEQGKC